MAPFKTQGLPFLRLVWVLFGFIHLRNHPRHFEPKRWNRARVWTIICTEFIGSKADLLVKEETLRTGLKKVICIKTNCLRCFLQPRAQRSQILKAKKTRIKAPVWWSQHGENLKSKVKASNVQILEPSSSHSLGALKTWKSEYYLKTDWLRPLNLVQVDQFRHKRNKSKKSLQFHKLALSGLFWVRTLVSRVYFRRLCIFASFEWSVTRSSFGFFWAQRFAPCHSKP